MTTPNLQINGVNAATLPAFLAVALNQEGDKSIYHMKLPKRREERLNMADTLEVLVKRLRSQQ